ncbi:MAG: FKBP-type peptidyl-prolyl cis-trans isomerase [Desulfobacteraceae bacterium]|jgi:peptidylprolyl isomerase
MCKAKDGDRVKIHYVVRLEDGDIISKTKDDQPFEFTIGDNRVIARIEENIIGMEAGERKTMAVPPDEAYGHWQRELVTKIKKGDLPQNLKPRIGQRLIIQQPDGEHVHLAVTDIDEDTVTLDGNHPLAGQILTISVLLVAIA